MNAVVTYVDGLDPLWREDYIRTVGPSILNKRFRDWGTLKYHFRGLDRFMPFIDKIHLVVARESQVPAWVNRETVNVVLHRDIIPAEYLPTFNSSMIEMFLHRIPGLSEQYLYFNDDMYTVAPCSEEDFFPEGVPSMGFSRSFLRGGDFRYLVFHSDSLARKAAGMRPGWRYVRPQHTASPMLKSVCDEVYSLVEKEILSSLSPLRTRANYNQYLFLDYMYYKGLARHRRLSNKHFSLAAASIGKICAFLRNPSTKMVCINDVQMSQEKFTACREALLRAFEDILPEKSRYER
ncbi:MAG: hypothetical protein IKX37_04995 [Bacteroidales bacterium]|nr:hypothetical protein [Bacteroidales bacterium]